MIEKKKKKSETLKEIDNQYLLIVVLRLSLLTCASIIQHAHCLRQPTGFMNHPNEHGGANDGPVIHADAAP